MPVSFVLTQLPLADTVDDFWRMVVKERCSSIVMLDAIGSDDVSNWLFVYSDTQLAKSRQYRRQRALILFLRPLLRALTSLLKFKLVYRYLRQTAPPYFAEEFQQLSDVEARQCLRSASTSSLIVRRTRLSTIGDRAFPVAASRLWDTLPLMSVTFEDQEVLTVYSELQTIWLFSCI